MTPELLTIGQRTVECPGWRWMPGMLDNYGNRILCVHHDGTVTTSDLLERSHGYETYQEHERVKPESIALLPDLSDPATLGCLMAIAEEAYGKKARAPGNLQLDTFTMRLRGDMVCVAHVLWHPADGDCWAITRDWKGKTPNEARANALLAALEKAS